MSGIWCPGCGPARVEAQVELECWRWSSSAVLGRYPILHSEQNSEQWCGASTRGRSIYLFTTRSAVTSAKTYLFYIVSPVLHFVPIVWMFFTSAPCTYWITNNRWLRKCRRFSWNLVLQVRNFFFNSNLKNILENYQKFHLCRRTCEYQGSRRTFRGGEIFKNFSNSNSKTPYFRLLLQFFTPILTWW